jgi:hypothetical protein
VVVLLRCCLLESCFICHLTTISFGFKFLLDLCFLLRKETKSIVRTSSENYVFSRAVYFGPRPKRLRRVRLRPKKRARKNTHFRSQATKIPILEPSHKKIPTSNLVQCSRLWELIIHCIQLSYKRSAYDCPSFNSYICLNGTCIQYKRGESYL